MATDNEQHTRDELVNQLQQLATKIGRSPTVADLKDATEYPSLRQVLAVFETWNAAKRAAGLETFRKEGRGEPYSDAELLDRLQRLANEIEGSVTKQDVNESDLCPSAVTYQRRFGSWNKAKEKADLDIHEQGGPQQYSDAELLDMLRSLAADLDRPVRIRDVDNVEDLPDHTTFERRFGSWNKAKEQAGLDTIGKGKGSRRPTYPDDELLDLLRQRATEVTGTLTKDAMDAAEGYPSSSTYLRRFGSWKHAKKEAGLNE